MLAVSCSKEQDREITPNLTIKELTGAWSAKLDGSYFIKEFDEKECWSNHQFDKSFSITDNINKDVTFEFIESGILILTDKEVRTTYIDDKGTIGTIIEDRITKYFIQISDSPNNLIVDEYGLPWHINNISSDKCILYRPFYEASGGYLLYVYNLRRM